MTPTSRYSAAAAGPTPSLRSSSPPSRSVEYTEWVSPCELSLRHATPLTPTTHVPTPDGGVPAPTSVTIPVGYPAVRVHVPLEGCGPKKRTVAAERSERSRLHLTCVLCHPTAVGGGGAAPHALCSRRSGCPPMFHVKPGRQLCRTLHQGGPLRGQLRAREAPTVEESATNVAHRSSATRRCHDPIASARRALKAAFAQTPTRHFTERTFQRANERPHKPRTLRPAPRTVNRAPRTSISPYRVGVRVSRSRPDLRVTYRFRSRHRPRINSSSARRHTIVSDAHSFARYGRYATYDRSTDAKHILSPHNQVAAGVLEPVVPEQQPACNQRRPG